jgi:hypothetical protein
MRVAKDEHKTVVSIPHIVRVTVVPVEPQIVVIVFYLEDVAVTIRVSFVQKTTSTTTR